MFGDPQRGRRFFSLAPSYEGVALIAHVLHFSYTEIMELYVNEYRRFLEIAEKILKAGASA